MYFNIVIILLKKNLWLKKKQRKKMLYTLSQFAFWFELLTSQTFPCPLHPITILLSSYRHSVQNCYPRKTSRKVQIIYTIFAQMDVSVTLFRPSGRVTIFGGDRFSAGFAAASSGEGCLITRGTLSHDWERVLKCSVDAFASRSGECKWKEAYWFLIGKEVVRRRWLL